MNIDELLQGPRVTLTFDELLLLDWVLGAPSRIIPDLTMERLT